VCDGTGSVENQADDSDVPDDGNACTDGVCVSGTPSQLFSPAGVPCDQNGGSVCNGSGSCVAP
jgi:hypothetical protein